MQAMTYRAYKASDVFQKEGSCDNSEFVPSERHRGDAMRPVYYRPALCL